MLPAVLVQLRRPQRVHAPLQRQQLALAVGEDERHEGLLVAHLAHPARHGDEASETGGGLAMMPGHDLEGVAQRADQERVCRVELAGALDPRPDLGDGLGALEQARVVGMRIELGERDQRGCRCRPTETQALS
jgi:hypothetical protein